MIRYIKLPAIAMFFSTLIAMSVQAELLIVDSVGNRVMLASSFDGSIINQNFIVDNTLQTPTNAIDSGRGTIFVSDQLLDEVREYSYGGSFLGTVVGGASVDNMRGIAVRNNILYITVDSGANADTVQQFNLSTNSLSTFISDPSLISPSFWDVTFRSNDVLVSNSATGLINRYDLNGTPLGAFTTTPVTTIRQVSLQSNGDIIVANAGGGIVSFNSSGVFQSAFGPPSAFGVYPLENGNYIYGAGINLSIYNPNTQLVSPVLSGNQFGFRFIEFFDASAIPEPSGLFLFGLGLLSCLGLSRRREKVQVGCA